MRLFLLPISTRRTLIYCQRKNATVPEQITYLDKATHRAGALWTRWEQKESGWQKKVVEFGNKALKRIPYEEWGLKSIPPLSAKQKAEYQSANTKVDVSFPSALIPESKVLDVLKALGTEREEFHKKRIIYCFIGMPIVAPFALVPVIPNLPFFYLVYRAWSHWRAFSGSKHIQFLLNRKMIVARPSSILDTLYSARTLTAVQKGNLIQSESNSGPKDPRATQTSDPKETLVLDRSHATLIAKALKVPELDMELDRAIWQVQTSLKADEMLKEEKGGLHKAAEDQKREQGKG
ncbi:MAG: hypothetical protein M1818_006280 [Claussenomyces sp. TS43310]|nr:MAG: hypothetical protein M1818_006280 [Claussenomyces sp. TS43310]